jgi:hypothetical protein
MYSTARENMTYASSPAEVRGYANQLNRDEADLYKGIIGGDTGGGKPAAAGAGDGGGEWITLPNGMQVRKKSQQ